MTDPSIALAEPLVQEAAPRNVRCSRIVLVSFSLFIGCNLALLLSEVICSSLGALQLLRVHAPSISMVWHPMQLARVRQIPQMASTRQSRQPASTWHSMKPAETWQSTQSAGARQFTWLPVAAVSDDADVVSPQTRAAPANSAGSEMNMTGVASKAATPTPEDSNSKSFTGKLQDMFSISVPDMGAFFSKYGTLALGTHYTIFGLTLGASYAVVANGLPVEDYLPAGAVSQGAGTLGAAYVITSLTKPFRLAFEVAAVPILATKLGQDTEMEMLDEPAEDETEGEELYLPRKRRVRRKKIVYGLKHGNPPPWLVNMYKDYSSKPEARRQLEGTNMGRQLDDYEVWLSEGEGRQEPNAIRAE